MRILKWGALPCVAIVAVSAACWHGATKTDQATVAADWQPRWAKRLGGLPGLENVGEVAPGIYRGAQPKGKEGYDSLRKLGVKTVVNLRDLHDETEAVTGDGLTAIRIPLVADVRGSRPPTTEDMGRFLSILRDPAQRPVYFHCAFGADRTGTMCAVYRMEVCGWTPDEAFKEMEAFGFHTVWTSLSDFVKGYKASGKWATGTAPVGSQ